MNVLPPLAPCPAPKDKFLLQFYNFGLKKEIKMQQTIPFPKDHVTFQKKITKIEKELMWLNIVHMAKQFPKTHVGDQFSK